ncbi:MAG: glycoside-pentoside-hexuronide (GPH):cation symporter [Pseudolysinimonas sp.]
MTAATPSSTAKADTSVPLKVQGRALVAAGFGQNVILTTVTTFILVYLTQFVHLSTAGIAVVVTIITIAKFLDAIGDPVMGSLIDMTRTRFGKLRPFVLISAVPVAVLTGLLFTIPDIPEAGQLVFFGIVYVIWSVAYTVCDVPFWALIGSAFPDPAMRNRVISNVRAFGAISLGLATLGLPYLAAAFSFGKTDAAGWSRAVFLVAVVGMGLYLLAFFFTRERITESRERLTIRQLFGTLFRNTPLLLVLIGSIIGFGRQIVQAGGALFAVIAYGKNPIYFTYIGAAIIAGVVIAAFFTPLLLRRVSAKRLMIVSSLVGAALYLALWIVGYASLLGMVVFIFLTGLTLGIFLVVQTTLIADAVDDVDRRTGVRNDGISFATLTFSAKIMGALAVLVFGAFVVLAGYQAGVKITPQMQSTVFFSITIIPAISCVLSTIPFFFYKLGSQKSTENAFSELS